MVNLVHNISEPSVQKSQQRFWYQDSDQHQQTYEQPLNERMRTFLRLEFLYSQMLANTDIEEQWATRNAITNLLEIMAVLMRGDVRNEILKEVDRLLELFSHYQNIPSVDSERLDVLNTNLMTKRNNLQNIGSHYLNSLKNSEFLSTIKHRAIIPGGTCEFDMPEYGHWLRQPYKRRQKDLFHWISTIKPICETSSEILLIIRNSNERIDKVAKEGMYQHTNKKNQQNQILRISLQDGGNLFPEISGNQQRFTIRFLEWSTTDNRAMQSAKDVKFKISIC